MEIKIINKSHHPLPAYETIASAGMDLKAHLVEAISIQPSDTVIIPTGLFMEY
jgi:dUTP pyrophosphatase